MTTVSVELVDCAKPDCSRLVQRWSGYCCASCRIADEGQYEIDRHSAGCDQRAAARDGPGG